jgi:hypothetical protein
MSIARGCETTIRCGSTAATVTPLPLGSVESAKPVGPSPTTSTSYSAGSAEASPGFGISVYLCSKVSPSFEGSGISLGLQDRKTAVDPQRYSRNATSSGLPSLFIAVQCAAAASSTSPTRATSTIIGVAMYPGPQH